MVFMYISAGRNGASSSADSPVLSRVRSGIRGSDISSTLPAATDVVSPWCRWKGIPESTEKHGSDCSPPKDSKAKEIGYDGTTPDSPWPVFFP